MSYMRKVVKVDWAYDIQVKLKKEQLWPYTERRRYTVTEVKKLYLFLECGHKAPVGNGTKKTQKTKSCDTCWLEEYEND